MVEKVSFRCLIRMTYLLCRIFLYITILLDFLFWFLWEDFPLDIGQPQHFGHVAWLDSLPLLDIISSFVYTLYNRILYLHLPNGSIFWVLNFWLEILLAHWTRTVDVGFFIGLWFDLGVPLVCTSIPPWLMAFLLFRCKCLLCCILMFGLFLNLFLILGLVFLNFVPIYMLELSFSLICCS